jgi:methionyl-tRNA formyltransferase
METIKILFFGTTSDSVIVLNQLKSTQPTTKNLPHQTWLRHLTTIVTQPPRPIGRHQELTETPVSVWANENHVACLTFPTNKDKPWLYENEEKVIDRLNSADFDLIISACYGQKIPSTIIKKAIYGGINIHPSILPRFRGADPIPWTIMASDTESGVTLVTISDKFDQGKIIACQKIDLTGNENPDTLRTYLFELGAKLLTSTLDDYLDGKIISQSQNIESSSYARKLTRDDGYIPWEIIIGALGEMDYSALEQYSNLALIASLNKQKIYISDRVTSRQLIERMYRALTPWPGIWTTISIKGPVSGLPAGEAGIKENKKRLKILKLHQSGNQLVIDQVQLEGKNPVDFKQFQKAYQLN